jgi:transcriptional regulator with XRE-family HTH domain
MIRFRSAPALVEERPRMAKKYRVTFADRLTAMREAAGISQYRLAQLSGLTKQAISRLERGEGQPSWETVQALARGLGVTCEAFLTEPEEPPPPPPEPRKPGRKPKKQRDE